jgi:hypothetical protein
MPKQIQTQIPNPQGRIFEDLDPWNPQGILPNPSFFARRLLVSVRLGFLLFFTTCSA